MKCKVKCPVCGAEVNTGSARYATITPVLENPSYEEHFWIQIYYCTKDDAHTFGILRRVKEEAEKQQ